MKLLGFLVVVALIAWVCYCIVNRQKELRTLRKENRELRTRLDNLGYVALQYGDVYPDMSRIIVDELTKKEL